MKTILDNMEIMYQTNLRLLKTLLKRQYFEEYPEPFKWKVQTLYLHADNWIEICRIDNYLHENIVGSHVHLYGKKNVKRLKINFMEAERVIIELSKKIINENFLHGEKNETDFKNR